MLHSSVDASFELEPLIDRLNKSECVLFLGDAFDSGATQSARIASALVDANNAHGVCPIRSCKSGGRCIQQDDCAVPLFKAAQLFESRRGRHDLVELVRRRLEAGPALDAIARLVIELPVRLIVTSLYDDRIERGLELARKKFLSVRHEIDLPYYDPERVQVYRLFGSVNEIDTLILTEDDAHQLFIKRPTVAKILQAHIASKTLLFIGYRLTDLHFMTLYTQITEPIKRHKAIDYALQWPPDELEVARWNGKIKMINREPVAFLTGLVRSVRAQAVKTRRATLPSAPYKFLDYFTEEDAAIFFGRDLEADLLLSTILSHPLTVLYGRSGTGKTSLVRARLGPDLEGNGYHLVYTRMLADPASEVKAAVRGVPIEQLSYADRGRRLIDVLVDALPPTGRLAIVLDQFEEFFLRQGESVRRAFAQELADCLYPPADLAIDLRVLLSLRDDYLGFLDELSPILPVDVFTHRFKIENLSREKAALAIIKPAEAFGLPIEEALRSRLTADLEDQGLEATNLQIVLYRLYTDAIEHGHWSEATKQGPGLRLECYLALGGAHAILARYLDDVLAVLPEHEQEQARLILKSMVTSRQTKLAVSGQEITHGALLARTGISGDQVNKVLAYLRESRIVRKFGDQDQYELAHEIMVKKVWDWLSDEELWLLDIRDMLRRELSNYLKFKLLLARDKLDLLNSSRDLLNLEYDELELLARSALEHRYEAEYWFQRALSEGLALSRLWLVEGQKLALEMMHIIDSYRQEITAITEEELALLLRSSLAYEYEFFYWFQRARQKGVDILQVVGEQLPNALFRQLHSNREQLEPLAPPELRLLARSAVTAEEGLAYWLKRALHAGISIAQALGAYIPPTVLSTIRAHPELLGGLESADVELLLRCAIQDGDEAAPWFTISRRRGVAVAAVALEALRAPKFRSRVAAIDVLGAVGPEVAERLIDSLYDLFPQVRAKAIETLELLQPEGAWRKHLVFERYIPGGPFVMGSDSGAHDEGPAHSCETGSFYFQRYPITNLEYLLFRRDIGEDFILPPGRETHPVVGVTWEEACRYAQWSMMRLPTEAEWEKAASWTTGALVDQGMAVKRAFPWGESYGPGCCNDVAAGKHSTTRVGAFSPYGDSAYGVCDLAGNALEWCSSLYAPYPYDAHDGREEVDAQGIRVLRGGSFLSAEDGLRCTVRYAAIPPHHFDRVVGFRLAWSPTPSR